MNLSLPKLLFAFLLCGVAATAQPLSVSVSNSMKYGLGNEATIYGSGKKEYAENASDVRITMQNVLIGFRLELNDPPEFGERFTGMKKRFVEFRSDGLTVRAGDLYTLFNRGTSLNLFENKTLAYDTGIDGVYAHYRTSMVTAAVLSGSLDFVDPATIALLAPRHDRYSLRGALLELSLIRPVTVGISFVSTSGAMTDQFTLLPEPVKADIPELSVAVTTEPIDLFASYTQRKLIVERAGRWEHGSAFYASLSHSGDGYGITMEYKDYRFDIVDPSGADPFRMTRMMPFQNPPTVKKEHSYTSLSRNPHIVDFNDEVGMLAEVIVQASERTTVTIGGSLASRHYQYVLDRTTFTSHRSENGSPLLPSFDRSRSPFWEVTVDAEHTISTDGSYVKAAFDRRYDFTFFEFGSTYTMMTGVPMQVQWMLNERRGIKVTVEPLRVYHSAYQTDKSSNSLLLSLQYSESPDWSAGVRRESTTDPFDPSHRSVWLAADASYRFGSSNTVLITYGDERGGQVCTNGICRQVNPFSGFRFSLISQM
jgi:hypothetical protein